jgi:hypothetical protein
MTMTLPKFDIDNFFQQDANEIFSARSKGKSIHKTKNIDAAGDEIELPVNDIIKRRLPSYYYVGQGHIVDSNLNVSGQFDVVISDNKGSPILFSSENGTDYLTYESIYAVGEIKSTFYQSKKYIDDFVKKIKTVNDHLFRQPTPPTQLTQDINFSAGGAITISSGETRPYKNPLFKFMFFVDSGDADPVEVCRQLDTYNPKDAPNVLIFLDRGIALKTEVNVAIDPIVLKQVNLWPEFIESAFLGNYRYVFYEFESTAASCLAYLTYALNLHIQECMVLRSDLVKYHSKMFQLKGANTWK